MKTANSLLLLLILVLTACDTVAIPESPSCTAEIVGAQPGAAHVGDLPENPGLAPWVALRHDDCTDKDLDSLNVQLFAVNDGLVLGSASLVSNANGCAVYEWPETKTGFGTTDDYVIVAAPPVGSFAMLSSFQVPDYQAPSVLPSWRDGLGEWSLFLISPIMEPGCAPTP
jgi:hypothetical protein